MPDFGLTEALEAAMKAASESKVMRPAEAKLAASAGEAAPGAAAPAVPGTVAPGASQPVARIPSVQTPSAAPVGVQAPPINPSVPPPDVPPAEAAAAAENPAAAVPAPQADTEQAAAAAPPVAPAAALQDPPRAPVPPKPGTPGPAAPPVLPAPPEAPAPVSGVQADAQRFVQANLSDFDGKLDMSHMPNVDVMATPDKLKAAILQVADDNKDAVNAARRGKVGDDQLIGLAQDMALNTDVVSQVLTREFGTSIQRPEVTLAARMVEQNQLGNLYALAAKVGDGSATSQEILQYQQLAETFAEYHEQLAGAKAEWGRGGRALAIPVGLSDAVADHVAGVIKQNNGDLQATAQAIRLAGTPSGISQILMGSKWARSVQLSRSLLHRIFINGILSGPTLFKILWNNTINLGTNALDVGAASAYRGMANLAARIGRYPTPGEGAAIEDAIANVHGTLSGFMDGLRVAGRVLKTGQSMDEVARSAEDAPNMAKTTADFFPEANDTIFGRTAHVVDKVIDYPGRLIAAGDDFTKTMGYRGYLTMMTMKEVRARLLNGTLKPGDETAVVQQMMEHPTPEMEQAAEAWAHRMTFQTPWTQGGPGEAFQNVLSKVPALRFIFPFMRTATNIFKQSFVERTPIAFLSARVRNQMAAGGLEGDLARSRVITGTLLGSSLAWMAINDQITGGAPKDAKERLLWEADGRQPYSIRITDPVTGQSTWRSYQWFEPMASIAGATADAVGVMRYIHGDDESDTLMPHDMMAQDAAAHIIGAIIENVGNKTFMQGAAAFSEMYNDPARAFGMWIDQMGSSFVPFSGLTKMARNFQDPYLRQAYTLIDKIKDDLPTIMGVKGSKTLPSRLDFFGEPRLREGGNSIFGPLTPMPGSPSEADDPVLQELGDVAAETRTVPITMPSKQLAIGGAGRGLQDGQGMRLTPEEYNDYVRMSRNEPAFDNRTLNLRDKLEQVFKSPTYQTLTPAQRSDVIKFYTSQADKFGRARLWNENDDFRERMQAWTAEKNRIKFGQ